MFDLHGVLENAPHVYQPLMQTMRACGHYVIVCSGPTISQIYLELDKLGYKKGEHYDLVISVIDFLQSQGVEFETDEKGNLWTSDEIWWKSKGDIARLHNIDIAIDDSEEYKANMSLGVTFLLMK